MAASGDTGLLELDVGAIAAGGGCVGRAPDGRVVFVRHALPDERVVARVTATTAKYLRADAVEILTPSPDRVPPPCPHAGPGRCGGCDFQHVELGAQRRLKAFPVAEQLARVAGIEREVEVEPVGGDVGGLHWRSRVRVAVDGNGAVGFRSPLHGWSWWTTAPSPVPPWPPPVLWPPGGPHCGARGRHGRHAGRGLRLVDAARRTPRLPEAGSTGLVVRRKVVRPPGAVHADVRGHTYSAGVFWQVHTGAAAALLDAVLAMVGDCRGARIVDLYAGAGLFSVAWPKRQARAALCSLSNATQRLADAQHNAAGLANLEVIPAEVTPGLVATGLGDPDIVVLDPAREGAGKDVTRPWPRRQPPSERSSTSRATRPGSPATSTSCSTGAGASSSCAASTSSP